MALQNITDLKEPPVPGQFYLVPAVFYIYSHVSLKRRWWPVLGPKHEDADHLNFKWVHYHLDRRFLSDATINRAHSWGDDGDTIIALGPIMEPHWGNNDYGPMPEPQLRRMKCHRAGIGFPPASERSELFRKFYSSYRGRKCPRDAEGHLICPHKGARLTSLVPNEQGIITCPLHGLLIDLRTETVMGGT